MASKKISYWIQDKVSNMAILLIKILAVLILFIIPVYFTALRLGWIDWDLTKIDWNKVKSDATSNDTTDTSTSEFTQKKGVGGAIAG